MRIMRDSLDATDNDIGQSRERVIRRAQQRAPQSDAVAGKRERYNLPSAVGQKLEAARPSRLKDVGAFDLPDLRAQAPCRDFKSDGCGSGALLDTATRARTAQRKY